MNKLLILLLVIVTCSLNAQTLKITYTETKDAKEILKSIDNPSIRKMVAEKLSKPVTYEFLSCNGMSLYSKITDGPQQGEYVVYKNHIDSTMVEQTNLMMNDFLVNDEMKSQNWVIHEETQTIGGFKCEKATRGEKTTAWFTEELPISDGPRAYYGLPGLILRLELGVITVEASKMELIQENTELTPPTKGKKMSREEFNKFKEEKLGAMKNGAFKVTRM